LISDIRTCEPNPQKDLVFIIGSGSEEFADELKAAKEVLAKFELKGDFALLNNEEKGLDAFCKKICSKILNSRFCIVMLNDPQVLDYIDKETGEEKKFRVPRPNVYYEFGIAVALRKRIIPIMRKGMPRPFDIQHLDIDIYENLDELRQKLEVSVKATSQKPRREELTKKPELELALLDSEGKPTNEIFVSPIFTHVKREKTTSPFKATISSPWFTTRYPEMYGLAKEPPEDVVPIKISIVNKGERVAKGVNIFLDFPEECQLFSKSEFSHGLVLPFGKRKQTSGGLFISRTNKTQARAWIHELGNDLMNDDFDEVYVRFKEEEYECKIVASVTQYDYPTNQFEFKVSIKPKVKEKIEYVYDKPKPEDMNPESLDERIKDLGKEDENRQK
jgi:hypothetical protein